MNKENIKEFKYAFLSFVCQLIIIWLLPDFWVRVAATVMAVELIVYIYLKCYFQSLTIDEVKKK